MKENMMGIESENTIKKVPEEKIASNEDTQSIRVTAENVKAASLMFKKFKEKYEEGNLIQNDTIGLISYIDKEKGLIRRETFTIGYFRSPEMLMEKIDKFVEKMDKEDEYFKKNEVGNRLREFSTELNKLLQEEDYRNKKTSKQSHFQ